MGKDIGMSWEQSVSALFEDLEQQAQGLALDERAGEVEELSLAEYAQVSLAGRLHASSGASLRLRLVGGLQVSGDLARAGEDWLLLVDRGREWLVRQLAVQTVAGLSSRADDETTWPVVDRLALRALLRRLATETQSCVVHFVDDHRTEGRIGRVGRDFLELVVGEPPGHELVVPVGNVAALQARR